jgi:hypothetical protein
VNCGEHQQLLPKEEIEINKKFFDHREFHVAWARRDLSEWMAYHEAYGRHTLIPKAVELKIVYYPDKDDHDYINMTPEFARFNSEMASKRLPFNDEVVNSSNSCHTSIEYDLTYIVAKYLGLTYEQFCKLPSSDPEKCRLIFDLEDLVFRLINTEKFIEQAKEQDELIREREEFRRRILKK